MESRLALLRQLHHDQPADPFNLYALALEYAKHDVSEAAQAFRQLLTHHPDYLPTYYHAADLFASLGYGREADETYQKGIQLAQQQGDQKAHKELNQAYNNFLFEQDED